MSVLDLFSGAGGFSLGLEQAGLFTKYAVEMDKFAAETFSSNFNDARVLHTSVTDISDKQISNEFKDVDIIVGGPPCQGFSVAGPSQYGIIDKRNQLVFEMLRYSRILKPSVCVIENVPGLARKNKKNTLLETLISEFYKVGYQSQIIILDSKFFGVPQSRKRCFLIFKRNSPVSLPIFNDAPLFSQESQFVSVDDAISDLNIENLPSDDELPIKYDLPPLSEYQKRARATSDQLYNHVPMQHTKRLIERFKVIEQGQSLKDVPPEHGQRRRGTQNLDARMRFKMNNQRLHPDRPSLAITASFQSNFVHPYRHRNLTAREGARLMSYPDSFRFFGPRTLMSKKLLMREGRENEIGLSQYNQIGNSVPPLLAKAVGHALVEYGL